MEKFLSLPVEKQNSIIDAALRSFGKNGYKKSSVNDIASAAGISKSMIFHYFGTKKALYLYLIDFCGNLLMKEINEKLDQSVTDFFDRIKLAADIEISVLKQHLGIISFLNSVFSEDDEEVKTEIKALLPKGEDFRSQFALTGMDAGKFKEGVDPKLVLKMLTWITEGYMSELPSGDSFDVENMSKVLEECLNLLKNNLYREEYL